MEALYAGREGVVQAAELRVASGHNEQEENCLYPLERSCDWRVSGTAGKLNPDDRWCVEKLIHPTRGFFFCSFQ